MQLPSLNFSNLEDITKIPTKSNVQNKNRIQNTLDTVLFL